MWNSPSDEQLDHRWIQRFRALNAYDEKWWLTWAGPFTSEEQAAWDRLADASDPSTSPSHLRQHQALLLKHTREREVAAAWEERRNPRLHYPAIELARLESLLTELQQLAEEIRRQETNPVIRRLYLEAIDAQQDTLRLIDACARHDRTRFWHLMRRLTPPPTQEELGIALAYVKRVLRLAADRRETADLSRSLQEELSTCLPGFLEATPEESAPLSCEQKQDPARPDPLFGVAVVARFLEKTLAHYGCPEWRVAISVNASNASVDAARRVLILQDRSLPLANIRHLIVHELGHVFRSRAGAHSRLGLLEIGTRTSALTEEGLVLYQERLLLAQQGQVYNDAGQRLILLAIGLASGIFGPPLDFWQLWQFLATFAMLPRLLRNPTDEWPHVQQQARDYALSLCLRVFRGVPCLDQPGICNTKDVIYIRGLRMIERAVARDATLLQQLNVGKVGLEDLEAIHTLGIQAASSPSLVDLASDPHLEDRIRQLQETAGASSGSLFS
jgi:hypothetical protein